MDPFLAEIRIFGLNFAPVGWAFCNGQLLPIAQNTALFSLLGTQYGGNGTTTFALPYFQGSAVAGFGNGPGLTPRTIGEVDGSETVTLSLNQLASHNHNVNCNSNTGDAAGPGSNVPASAKADRNQVMYTNTVNPVSLNPSMVSPAGSGQPHNNMSPYRVLNYCIATSGVYPSRN